MQLSPIEWTDRTWNVVTGCLNKCPYCYARKLACTRLRGRFGYPADDPFKPTFHTSRLYEPIKLKKPSMIFVSSMGDLFGEGVQKHWIDLVLKTIENSPQHTFQLLTKNPDRYDDFDIPKNAWMGYSTTSKLGHMLGGRNQDRFKFVSLEPFMEPTSGSLHGVDLLIVGAETGHRPDRVTASDWADRFGESPATSMMDIITECEVSHTKLFIKDSMAPFCTEIEISEYKQLPKEWTPSLQG